MTPEYLNPSNAATLFANLQKAADKLPPNPEKGKLLELMEKLAPMVGTTTPALEAVLPSYLVAQKAIIENNTTATENPKKRLATPISRLLSEICAYANSLTYFCPPQGDAIIDDIFEQVVKVSKVLI